MNVKKHTKKTRLLSLLLTLCMVMSLLPMTALAADPLAPITEVAVTNVPTPVAGQPCSTDGITITTSPANAAVKTDSYWFDETDDTKMSPSATFTAEHEYCLVVELEPNAGFAFEFEASRDYSGTATFNNEAASFAEELVGSDTGLYIESGTVTAKASTPITTVDVSGITLPVVGATPDYDVTLPEGANYHLATAEELTSFGWSAESISDFTNGVFWKNATDNSVPTSSDIFEADETYFFGTVLVPNTGYKFDSAPVATLNGSAELAKPDPTPGYIRIFSVNWTPLATATYDVWVDGTQVTSSNKADILTDGTASYNPNSQTLTLDGYEGGAIRANQALTVTLADGSVNTVTNPESSEVYCISAKDADLTINGSGDLKVIQNTKIRTAITTDTDGGNLIIDMEGDLNVTNYDWHGLYAFGSVTISGSGDVSIYLEGNGTGIVSGTDDIILSGSGELTVDAKKAACAVRLKTSGKSLRLNGTGAPLSFSAGTYAAIANQVDNSSPVDGTNLAYYDKVTGAPDTASVVYDHTIESIDSVAVTNVPTPVAGQPCSTDGITITTSPENAADVKEFYWVDNTDDTDMSPTATFTAGHEYYLVVTLVPKAGFAFEFDSSSMVTCKPYTGTATINGEAARKAEELANSDTGLYISSKYVTAKAGGGSSGGGSVTTNYTLTFNTNGGSKINSISKTSGTTVDLASYKPTKDGYTFDGWYADTALTDKVTSVKLTKDTTVYAKWVQNASTGTDLPFIDVKSGDWFYEDVVYVFENGLMNGTSSTTFSPLMTTTRGMIVTVLYRQAGSPTVSGNCPFNDVKSGMYYEAPIAWAAANGIVKGYSADKFGPDDPITREQMAAILYRYAQYKSIDVSAKADLSKYNDAARVSDWAKDAIAWTVKEGIFNGVGDSLLSPETQATRAQIAAILHRFCENIAK